MTVIYLYYQLDLGSPNETERTSESYLDTLEDILKTKMEKAQVLHQNDHVLKSHFNQIDPNQLCLPGYLGL